MGKYFGTDGVRGVAGADLTCEMAMLIGRGAAAARPPPPVPSPEGIPASPVICWKLP